LDIYFKKRRWKRFIFLAAVLIGFGSLLYTNMLVKETSNEEREKAERWAEATKIMASKPNEELDNDVANFLINVISSNSTIPIIVVDEAGNVIEKSNIQFNPKNKDKVLAKEYEKMKARQLPIVIPLGDDENQYLYYKESSLLVKLKYYPIFQLAVIVIFIVVAYVAFSTARKTEQNLVWIGMAKETAHQLGTPISSLMAWIELLKDENVSPSIIEELDKDMSRLEKITERFSKVGSVPELYPENLYQQLQNSLNYLQTRVSKKITFQTNYDSEKELCLPLSASLFSWVIENLVRNSVDAIGDKKGAIELNVTEKENEVYIDLTDNGKGIPKSSQKSIFQPGVTSKKRGWGLGLSLSKRIIEIYHKGKLFLKSSEPYTQTTFRIILKKKPFK
jgi:nitrogen-specific signal transduction histidine kinase